MDRERRHELSAAMRRLAQGDREAVRDVFEGVWAPVRAFCARLLGEGPDADDAAQETMLKLFGRAVEFDPRGDALAWALTLALWECRTVRRRRWRNKELAVEPAQADSRQVPSPEEAFLEREAALALEESLGRMSSSDRELLEGKASAARPASDALRKRKQRALARLRVIWRSLHGTE